MNETARCWGRGGDTTTTFAKSQVGIILTSSLGHCFPINYQTLTYPSYGTVKEFDKYLADYSNTSHNSGIFLTGNHISLCCNLAWAMNVFFMLSGCRVKWNTGTVCHRRGENDAA